MSRDNYPTKEIKPVIPKPRKVEPKKKPRVKKVVRKDFTPVQVVNQIATLKSILG